MNNNVLRQHVREMKSMASILMPHTFPLVDFEEENDTLFLKQRTITVDGYELEVILSKADYKKHHMITLNIKSAQSPFLPFNLVCKVAQAFLGKRHLAYAEFLKDNKKIYCWTLKTTSQGRVVPTSKDLETSSYEGFEYNVLNQKSVG